MSFSQFIALSGYGVDTRILQLDIGLHVETLSEADAELGGVLAMWSLALAGTPLVRRALSHVALKPRVALHRGALWPFHSRVVHAYSLL